MDRVRAVADGVDPARILIDAAHDFGKNTWQSLEITRRLGEMTATGWPVLVSLSNKDFVGETLDAPPAGRRGPKAPGHFDERAAAFDAAVEKAVRAGDLGALLDIDPALARDLMATGRPAWQLLAGALRAGARPEGAGGGPAAPAVKVQYAGDPFGVKYLVASLIPSAC